jgi:hypothetical protein
VQAASTGASAAAELPAQSDEAVATEAPQRVPKSATVRATAPAGSLAARTGELTNPDDATMVFLYYDLAGIAPPIDRWVEKDYRVYGARGADRAAQRAAVKAAFEAGMAAVRGVGVIHLTSEADLGDYDPTYGEFTVGALSPGSAFTFSAPALNQTIRLTLDNGLVAQTWSVPQDRVQPISDKIGTDPLTLETTLKVDKVLPGTDGGTIVARVLSWQLRNARDGTPIARVKVPQS